jgi:RecA-family ATPase
MSRDPRFPNIITADELVAMSDEELDRAENQRLTFSKVAAHAVKIPGRLDVASWHGKIAPERRWIVDGLLPEGNVTMLAGDGGLGKSILALQAQAACALGKQWLGRPTRPCRSIGLYCEDDEDEIWRRLEAIARDYGATAADLAEHVQIFSRVGLDNLLMEWRDQYEQGETTGLYSALHNVALDFGAELIVLDSLHDVFGGNENSRAHARQFIGAIRVIAQEISGAALVTAHPSLSGRNTGTGEAGSTAWNNAVRSRLYLTEPKADDGQADGGPSDYRELRTMKSNYGPLGGKIRLRWNQGVFVPEDAPGASGGMVASLERRRIDDLFLACLDATLTQGRAVSDSRNAGNYAPRLFAAMAQAQGTKAPELARAMERLFAGAAIRIGTCGFTSSRHPRPSIVRSTDNGTTEGSKE